MDRRTRRGSPLAGAVAGFVLILVGCVIALDRFEGHRAIPADDLDLLADPLDPVRSRLDDHLTFALDWLAGASVSDAEFISRFSSRFLAQVPITELRAGYDTLVVDAPYALRGVATETETTKGLSLRGVSGEYYLLGVSVEQTAAAKMDGLTLFVDDVSPEPMSAVQLGAAIAAGLALGIAGVAVTARRAGGLGLGWVGAGLLSTAQLGQLASASPLFTVGVLAGPAALATTAALVGAGPRRARRAETRVVGAVCGFGALVGISPFLLLDSARFGLPALPVIHASVGAARALASARAMVTIGVVIVVVGALARRLGGRAGRVAPLPTVGAGMAAGLITLGVAVSWLVGPARLDLTMSAWLNAALVVVAVGAVASVGLEPLDLRGVAQLVVDIGDETRPSTLQDSIRLALDDPTVELWHWSDDLSSYVTPAGVRCDLERLGPDRQVRHVTARDRPLAVVVHDATRAISADRLAAVAAAARLAIDIERLQADVRFRLAEVQASRTRLVEAGEAARRQVERDLHDGAQQRLLAVLLQVRRMEANPAAGSLRVDLRRVGDDLAVALEELRAIGRGLHPPALDHGLAAALQTLAETAPLPVELTVDPDLAPSPGAVDAAVYFIVAEAITNVVRHAGATHVRVDARAVPGGVRVEIADDGRGGASVGTGTGLQRLADRAAALGGSLTVDSPSGHGTVVRLWLPAEGPTDPAATA